MLISFDLDGVLIQNPFQKGVFPHMRQHIRRAAALQSLAPEDADRHIDEAVRNHWGEAMKRGDFVGAYDWDATFRAVNARFGGENSPDVATLVQHYSQDPEMVFLLPGALECLTTLHAEGHRLFASTNGYHAYQWPVLEALGIAHFFEDLLSPEKFGYAKPDPRFFAAIAGLEMHVGDTLVHDVLGANKAGLISVWVAPDLPSHLHDLSPSERSDHADFTGFLAQSLESNLYRAYHVDADLESCHPYAVVVNVRELPRWLDALLEK